MHAPKNRSLTLLSAATLLALFAQSSRTLAPPQGERSAGTAGDLTVNGSLFVAGPHPWFDARTFGLEPGGAQAAARLQAAIDAAAAAGGGTVVAPAGDYRLDTTLRLKAGVELRLGAGTLTIAANIGHGIVLESRTSLCGAGAMGGAQGGTEIFYEGTPTMDVIVANSSTDALSRATVRDLRLVAGPTASASSGISVNVPNFCVFEGITALGFEDAGFELKGAIFTSMERCFAGSCNVGIRLTSGLLGGVSQTTASAVRIEQFAADQAAVAGILLQLGNPSVTQVHVDGYRYEAGGNSSATAVRVDSFGNAQLALDNFAAWTTDGFPAGGTAIEVVGPSGGVLTGSNWSLRADKYTNILDDATSQGTTLRLADFAPAGRILSVGYHAGAFEGWVNHNYLGRLEVRAFDDPSLRVQVSTGTAAPSAPAPNGSLYLRQSGAAPGLYVREQGAWAAK